MNGVEKFTRGTGFKKYKAYLKNGETVQFGDTRYEHYRDNVPKNLGGGLWNNLDHNDSSRRAAYRKRAAKQDCGGFPCISIMYSPAWFSYHYLW